MVCNADRHGDDEFKGCEFGKYKRMIEDSKKPFYPGCGLKYSRLFAMVKLFQLKAIHG
jgi:hypothetical protein